MNRCRAALLAVLAAAGCGRLTAASAAPARIDLSVSIPEASRGGALQEDAVLRGIVEAAVRAWPALLEIRPGEAGDAAVRVTLTRDSRAMTVATELVPRSGAKRTLRSTVPPDAVQSAVATAATDLAWLWASAADFAGLALQASPPPLAAVLETDALSGLTGWPAADLEPLAIASSAEGLTLLFPRGWLTLGPLFRISAGTARDLQLQGDRAGVLYTGLARSSRGSIVVARDDGTAQAIDPLLATRRLIPAPAGARLLSIDGREPVFLAGSVASLVPAYADAAGIRQVRIFAAWTSVVARDAAGDLWAWDGQERRIRVTTPEGREIAAVRPLVRASDLPVPQSLAVLADGSFLLGGSGVLWRFESSGVPSWRITGLPGIPGGSLPAAFQLAADRSTGAIWVLDGPSRRVLQFGGTGRSIADDRAAEAARGLADLLQELDERSVPGLEHAATVALTADLPLEAARLAARLARQDAPGAEELAAAAEVLASRDLARAAAGFTADLAAVLIADRALEACQQAVELARVWRDRDPGNAEAGLLVDELTARRRELRDATSQQPDAPALAASVSGLRRASGGARTVVVRLVLRAPANAGLAGLRVSFVFPGWTPVPAAVDAGALAAGEVRTVELELALADSPEPLPAVLPGAAWMQWQRGREGRSCAVRLEVAAAVAQPEGVLR